MHLRTDALIGGKWIAGSSTFAVADPGRGEPFAEVADSSVETCVSAVDAAAEAQSRWARSAPMQRSEILRSAFDLMRAEEDRLAELIVRENGKALPDAKAEVRYAAEFFRWFSHEAVRIGGEFRTAPNADKHILVRPEPVGVSLLITPWNFPAAMATRKLAPALAAGCCSVLKPAEDTPLTALAIAEILQRAGVPAGVVNVVTPRDPVEPVRAMLAHPAMRKLSFTGSTAVGSTLLELAAPAVLRCSLELGGGSPFIVCADAPLDAAVKIAMTAKMRNGGASCIAANRFLVHDSVADAFTDQLTTEMSAMELGHGLSPGTTVGAMVNEAERDRVARLVERAAEQGARLRCGGKAPARPGYFYPPTVLDQVPSSADITRAEIFGPVAPVVTFSDEDEALAMANDSLYGLMAYVVSSDVARATRLASQLESGMVSVNAGLISDPAAPFGGVKRSGLGREGGFEGIEEFLEHKYIGIASDH